MEASTLLLGPKSVERLQKIKKHIQEEPHRFIMEEYSVGKDANFGQLPYWYKRPPCGTTACICGWANIFSSQEEGISHQTCNVSHAIKWLDLGTDMYCSGVYTPFNVSAWPLEFRVRYNLAQTAEEAVAAASDYIGWLCAGPKREG